MTGNQSNLALDKGLELLGEVHPLLEQLGSADGLFALQDTCTSLSLPRVESRPALLCFLAVYRDEILLPHELPAIRQAYHHAVRHQCRELLGQDLQYGSRPALKPFLSASRRVGRDWLRRLRPLRDQRLVQRYLQAVEDKQATGWHTLVYGVTLAVFSLPVRQGLLNYASHALAGFIHAAALPLHLSEKDCRSIVRDITAPLPAALERALADEAPLRATRSGRGA